ncbi:MAG: hypothetical protein IJ632_06720 [Muribaculaceae bacterium]|nr:hypothetical protein [Muribaculaceae bacterium]
MNKTSLCLILCIALFNACDTPSTDIRSHEYQPYWGIDLSHHNTVTDWSQVEVDFVILKATEGATYKDPNPTSTVKSFFGVFCGGFW